MQKQKPHILVTGIPRSGTTWVGRTISESPYIDYYHEPFNKQYPNPKVSMKAKISYVDARYSDQKNEIMNAFEALLQSHPSSRVLVKDPSALVSANWLHENFGFKTICMIRNPFGFIASLKKAGWKTNFENFSVQKELMNQRLAPFKTKVTEMLHKDSNFVEQGCLLWNIFHFLIRGYQSTYQTWHFVYHEEAALKPVETFKDIFAYVEVPFDENIKNYIRDFTSESNPVVASNHLYQPRSSKELLYLWKDILSASDIDRIKESTYETGRYFYPDLY